MSILVFVSRDFELGRTWLAGGVDCQCHTGLIFNGNLGPVFPHFRDIAGFLLKTAPHPIHPNFGVVPLGLLVGAARSKDPKLINRTVILRLT